MIPRPFYFLRHGETDWNKAQRLQGHTDVPLNETGRAQAAQAVVWLKDLPLQRIVTSPLDRARETAEIVNRTLGLPVYEDAGLKERGFGEFEGREIGELARLRQSLADRNVPLEENGHPCPPGAETYSEFRQRIAASMSRALNGVPAENVLFVAHGGVYRVLCRALLGLDDHSGNAVPFHFDKQGEGWVLACLKGES